jgi:hypothetical protein
MKHFKTFENFNNANALKEENSNILIDGKPVKISSIELENVDVQDRPDFVDAYASYAEFEDGQELTDDQLDKLKDDYPEIINQIANEY